MSGLSACVVYMGLDATAEELGLNEYSYLIYSSMDTDDLYTSFGTLEAPRAQAALCLNNAIPDCSPPGTCIVSITTLYNPDAWQGVTPQEYASVKSRVADGLITHFEEATSTSIRDHIEEFEVATPQTFARYTRSYNGTIYGYEPEPWDSLIPRMMSMMGEEKHFDGLGFCGGSAFRCHGYSSTVLSGQTTALIALRDIAAASDAERR